MIGDREVVGYVARGALIWSTSEGLGPLLVTVTDDRLLLVAGSGWRGRRIQSWEIPIRSIGVVNVVIEGRGPGRLVQVMHAGDELLIAEYDDNVNVLANELRRLAAESRS